MSWISINDIRSMISFIIENESISGPVNLVSNHPVTNQTFTRTLGKALNRPTLLPMPAVLARTMFGEMADALLLSSSRVLPKKLNAAGYRFIDNDLEKAFTSLLKN
jgi:NAD dependent epimerase/dehydratase family enzyme